MDLDVTLLSRIQFALTVMFHYIFPPLTIGMGIVIVYLEAMFLWKIEKIYETAAKFWAKIFAVNFALGVATGIVMEFQFGTNWAVYSRFVGDIFGAALAAEGVFAFFLESGFLAILVFGWDKVSPLVHFIASLMVALGSIFSAIWIIVANSWQQTPAGHRIVQMTRDGQPWFIDGRPVMRAELVDFWTAVLNPSTLDRLTHTLIGAFIMGAFFIMSISAYYIIKGRHTEFARRSFSGALIFATTFSLAQLVSGHSNSLMVAKHQPAKMAAMEGHFNTAPANLSLIGFPDEEENKTHFDIAIPGFLSFLIYGNSERSVLGLNAFERKHWPPVLATFLSYHVMVWIGMFFIAVTLLASWLRLRGSLFEQRWLLKIFVASVVLAIAANQLGWITTEVGRQPWIVYPTLILNNSGEPILDAQGLVQMRFDEGLLTSQAVSEVVTAPQVLSSIIMFGLIYLLLLGIWIYVLHHKILTGPTPAAPPTETTGTGVLESVASRTEHVSSMTEAKPNVQPGTKPMTEGGY